MGKLVRGSWPPPPPKEDVLAGWMKPMQTQAEGSQSTLHRGHPGRVDGATLGVSQEALGALLQQMDPPSWMPQQAVWSLHGVSLEYFGVCACVALALAGNAVSADQACPGMCCAGAALVEQLEPVWARGLGH